MTRRTFWLCVATICVIGLWLRMRGLGFGLPAVYNMDEVAIMNRAMAFGTGDLNPKNFLYPTFYFYALFAWEGLTFVAGLAAGWWDSLAAFQREFFLDPSRLYWSGRFLTTLCGVATIAVVAMLAARILGRAAAITAALMLAVMPIAVMDAHYVKHDVPVTLLIVLVHLVLARMVTLEGPAARRDVWLVGALAGLAMSTHYYAVIATLPVGAVLLTQAGVSRTQRIRDVLRAAVTATLVFIIASPFLLPNLDTALRDISQNRAIVIGRATEARGAFGSMRLYIGMLLDQGGTGFAATLIGWALAWRDRRQGLVLTMFPIAFLLFIGNTVPATRYLNPVLPFVAMGTAVVVSRAIEGASATQRALAGAFLFIVMQIVSNTGQSIRLGTFFQETDTRTQAQHFIEREVPPGSSVLVQPYSVPLRQSRDGLIEALRKTLGSEDRATIKFQQQLALSPYPAPAYRTIFLGDGGLDKDKIYVSPRAFDDDRTLAPLRTLSVQYVVLKRYNVPDASLASLDVALADGAELVATFSPYRSDVDPGQRAAVAPFLHNTDARLNDALERPGPIIEIWRIN